MSRGQHVATCLKCGKTWVVGDCIPSFCSNECRDAWQEWWGGRDKVKENDKDGGQIVVNFLDYTYKASKTSKK